MTTIATMTTTLLAEVHLPPAYTATGGAFLLVVIAWYWRRLGDPEVPGSRRRIRRTSMAIMAGCLALVVAGMSFADGDAPRPVPYLAVWTGAVGLLGLVLVTVALDVLNNLRLHRTAQLDNVTELARHLGRDRAAAAADRDDHDDDHDGDAGDDRP